MLDEVVPGVGAEVDDLLEGFEDAVGEPVVAEVLPDVLDGVEFRGARRQGQECQVGRDVELRGGMLSGLIEDDHGVGAGGDLRGDLLEVPLHGAGVASGQDQGGAGTSCRTDRAEDVGRLGTLVMRRPRSRSPARPAPGDLVLLADPGLVLEPQLYGRAGREPVADRRDRLGEAFLNVHSLQARYDRAASVGADIQVTLKPGCSLHRRGPLKAQNT